MDNHFSSLTEIAQQVALRSHSPYSGKQEGIALLLADGAVVTGTRIENASFPLTILAWQAAWTRSQLISPESPVAIAGSTPLSSPLLAILEEESGEHWQSESPQVAARKGAELPGTIHRLELDSAFVKTDTEGVRLALQAAERAVVPASSFHVGCVVVGGSGRVVSGSNMESEHDWTRGLCAERVALASACVNGFGEIETLYLACPSLPGATPCGACRQVIAELAPEARIAVWNGEGTDPLIFEPDQLLPGKFSGEVLR